MKLRDFVAIDIAKDYAKEFKEAQPFPTLVLDNFIKNDVIEEIEKPVITDKFYKYENALEYRKYATDRYDVIPNNTYKLLMLLNSAMFLEYLEALTGIDGLLSDPYLRGGGLHSTTFGGKLDIHADRQLHPKLGLWRRLNLIIYLNRPYKEEYGGHLELWNKDMTECVQKIAPIWNRSVIFTTDAQSFHGHPEPWRNQNEPRNSLALYYWTAQRPPGDVNEESTKFQRRPDDPIDEEKESLRKIRNLGRVASNV